MRDSVECPKCHNTRILMVDTVPDTGEGVYDLRELYVARVAGSKRAGKLQAVVCRACGYAEEAVDVRHLRESAF